MSMHEELASVLQLPLVGAGGVAGGVCVCMCGASMHACVHACVCACVCVCPNFPALNF